MKALVASIFGIFLSTTVYGFMPIRTTVNTNLALGGYDPVVYYAEEKARRGSSTYSFMYDGVEWRFENKTNKNLFMKHPDMFIPAFGGYCAYGIAEGVVVGDEDPREFVIHDGKLYFFHNAEMLNTWKKNPEAFIKKAEAEWKRLVKSGEISLPKDAGKSEPS
ncbi:YHS domain-containing (seleno)protein [Rubellicoccus peritrichatus]|uniref:YHS domain-containing (Seleno)protein n=1 Tax=Rubellicoccus peritrichatus TaxID=3080537 RepID=A0AAQ3QUT4_9BACT|nr:YHS domain-containing (seleno)protein [Puniceicoccus sp. CR14]WOO42751.1 YHS domain-containing (seleno)protein [Puniceicoccus sp. CR14]